MCIKNDKDAFLIPKNILQLLEEIEMPETIDKNGLEVKAAAHFSILKVCESKGHPSLLHRAEIKSKSQLDLYVDKYARLPQFGNLEAGRMDAQKIINQVKDEIM